MPSKKARQTDHTDQYRRLPVRARSHHYALAENPPHLPSSSTTHHHCRTHASPQPHPGRRPHATNNEWAGQAPTTPANRSNGPRFASSVVQEDSTSADSMHVLVKGQSGATAGPLAGACSWGHVSQQIGWSLGLFSTMSVMNCEDGGNMFTDGESMDMKQVRALQEQERSEDTVILDRKVTKIPRGQD